MSDFEGVDWIDEPVVAELSARKEAAPDGVKDKFYKSGDGKELDDTFEIVQQMIDFGDE